MFWNAFIWYIGADVKSLSEKAHKLSNFLWSRKRAIETSQLREKSVLLEKKFLEQERDIHTGGLKMQERCYKEINHSDCALKTENKQQINVFFRWHWPQTRGSNKKESIIWTEKNNIPQDSPKVQMHNRFETFFIDWGCDVLCVLLDNSTLISLLCWHVSRYDEDLGLVYMAARLAGGYAAVLRALNEVFYTL